MTSYIIAAKAGDNLAELEVSLSPVIFQDAIGNPADVPKLCGSPSSAN